MKTISKEDLYWLAGLLEGEGCFYWAKNNSPLISLAMTDLDIVEKVRDIIHPNGSIGRVERTEKHKVIYRFKTYGGNSIEWMKLLYPLMGIRRREKISQILDLWNNRKPSGLERTICPKGHDVSDSNSYYLQGNHKICKICNKRRANEKMERDTIKAIAFSRNISFEEARKILSSLLSDEGGVQ